MGKASDSFLCFLDTGSSFCKTEENHGEVIEKTAREIAPPENESSYYRASTQREESNQDEVIQESLDDSKINDGEAIDGLGDNYHYSHGEDSIFDKDRACHIVVIEGNSDYKEGMICVSPDESF
ncbi:hypothetical protein [Marichromatium sp. AB31]|uniref:hypothetical protein n=1 Tax=Marichromatium sp. AB31 TaxID=2483362 RepID=UPI0011CD43F7|nr:hypothetical protein [Marichromatium sp. AB31]